MMIRLMITRMSKRLLRLLLSLVLLTVLAGGGAFAASDAAQTPAPQDQINSWNATLNSVANTLKREGLDNQALTTLRDRTQAVADDAAALVRSLAPQIAAVQQQIDKLGPATTDQTAPEPAAVTEARKKQQAALDGLNAISKQAEVARLRAVDLVNTISDRLSAHFITTLLAHDSSLLSPVLWKAVAQETPDSLAGTGRIVGAWILSIGGRSDQGAILVAALAILALIAAFIFLRHLTIRLATRTDETVPSDRRRIMAATWIVVISTLAPIGVLLIARTLLNALDFLPPGIDTGLRGVIFAATIVSLLHGLARGLLAPSRSDWRIVAVDDERAGRLYSLISLVAAFMAIPPIISAMAAMTAAAPDFSNAIKTLAYLIVAGLIVPFGRVAAHQPEAEEAGPAVVEPNQPRSRILWQWALIAAIIAAIVAIVAGLAGYLFLAQFLTRQIVWVGIVAAIVLLFSRFIDEAIMSFASGRSRAGRWLAQDLGFRSRTMLQGGVVASGVLRLLLLMIAAFSVAAPWGIDSTSLASSLRGVLFGIQIGSITLTFSSILAALIIFLVGLLFTRSVQAWLDRRLLPTTNLNAGLRNSIRTMFGYVGIILAAALAATYAGLNLSSVAIVAGALSVGIGFGLQSIVNNFVSGLILLAERPIRTGDWIAVGGNEGTVKRISVRATEIETFDRASVIIPNSDLISGVVKNMYLRDNSGRVTITVGVSYSADPEKVRDILLDCAQEHELVLKSPEPQVYFMDFGASSLDFELRCFLADISNTLTARSDLRFAILKHLREAGIEIPFPQRDLNLRDLPRIEQILTGRTGREPQT